MFAVLFAVAVARVVELVDARGIERNETESMSDELIGENGTVHLDFDEIDGDGRDFGLDHAAKGVGEGEICS